MVFFRYPVSLDLETGFTLGVNEVKNEEIAERTRQFRDHRYNPNHPFNKLKKPVTRKCNNCGKNYISYVHHRCDDSMCSDTCKEESEQKLIERVIKLRGEMKKRK